jgi:ribosome maturation factor RimP
VSPTPARSVPFGSSDIEARNSLKHDQLIQLLEPVVHALGLVLWGIEFVPQRRNSLLRIYIDVEGRLVTVDDCEAVSREVAAVLDVDDPIAGAYTLEVSSPGLDRPFFDAAQLAAYQGQQAKVQVNVAVGGRRRFQGAIQAVEGGVVTIVQDGTPVAIDWGNVQKASLVADYSAYEPKQPGPGRKTGGKPAGKGAGRAGKNAET